MDTLVLTPLLGHKQVYQTGSTILIESTNQINVGSQVRMGKVNESERFALKNIFGKGRQSDKAERKHKVLSGRHSGKGAEHLVAYQLYQNGFDNVALVGVDAGYDIIAVRSGETFQVQVKTSKLYGNSSAYNISKRTFMDLNGSVTFFVFVLLPLTEDQMVRFLIVPYRKIKQWIKQGYILEQVGEYAVRIRQAGSRVYLKDKEISDFTNNWKLLRSLGSRDKWGRTAADRARYHLNWIRGSSPSAKNVRHV